MFESATGQGLFAGMADPLAAPEMADGNPEGTFQGVISNIEVKPGTKNPEDTYIIFEFALEGCPFPQKEGKRYPTNLNSLSEDKTINVNGTMRSEKELAMWDIGRVRKFLSDIGVPAERHNSIRKEDLIGIPVVATLAKSKNNPRYTNVVDVKKLENVGTLPGGGLQQPATPQQFAAAQPAASPQQQAPAQSSPFGGQQAAPQQQVQQVQPAPQQEQPMFVSQQTPAAQQGAVTNPFA